MLNIYVPGINYQQIYYIRPEDLERKEELPEIDESESDEISNEESIEQKDAGIHANESIEELELTGNQPIKLDLKIISKKETIFTKGMFDSGASINCIDYQHANKEFKNKINTSRGFYVRTANNNIIINQYIDLDIELHNKVIISARFYLLKNSPYKYIISRSLFLKMGYRITGPGNKEFNNKSTYENLAPDLYEEITKHMDYPATIQNQEQRERYTETINYIKDQSFIPHTLHKRMKQTGYIHEMVMMDLDPKNPELKTDIGEIQNTKLKQDLVRLLRANKSNYAHKRTDIGKMQGIEFKIDRSNIR